jgi:dinuclear metal center YbgI/SA1388 family protein
LTLPSKTMSLPLSQLLETFEELWPISGAEDWDRPGLTTGSTSQQISKVLLCLDVTREVLAEARDKGCELVVSHHPVLLKSVNFLSEDLLKGELVSFAVKNGMALYAAHTNADIVVGGVSDVLARTLGLTSIAPLVPTGSGIGHGRVGKLKTAQTLSEFAEFISRQLPKTNAPVRVAGDKNLMIETVAVVGGAGDSFIPAAAASGAQVLVTSDLRHHVTLDAISDPSAPLALIDVSHFAAESLWLEPTRKLLAEALPQVSFEVSRISTDPWTMTVSGKSNSEG